MTTDIKTLAAAVDAALDAFEAAARDYVTEAHRLDHASRQPGRMETPEFAHAMPHVEHAVKSRLARLQPLLRSERGRDADGQPVYSATLPLPEVRRVASRH